MDMRRWPLLLAIAAMGGLAALTTPPHAQKAQEAQEAQDDTQLPEPDNAAPDALEAKVKALIRNADEWTGAKERRKRCQPSAAGQDIVVCGDTDRDTKFRVPPDTEGRVATGGPPPAPDVAGDGIFKGKATLGGCMVPPCPPPPAYFIDFSKMPDVDEAYLKKAREAETAERVREAASKESKGKP